MTVLPAIGYFSRRITAQDRGGSYVEGRWVEASASDYNFYGVLNPAQPKDLEVLPEGDRSKDLWVCVTKRHLFQADGRADQGVTGLTQTYVALPDGQYAKVIDKKDWRHRGFFKYMLERTTDWDAT